MGTKLEDTSSVGQREDIKTQYQEESTAVSDADLDEKKKFISAFINQIRKKNNNIRSETIDHLLKYPDLATDVLVIALLADNPQIRAMAAFALGRSKNERIVNMLIQATHDECTDVRCWAAKSLGEIGDGRALQTLIRAMHDENELIRAEAAFALGKLKAPSAVDHLVCSSCMDPDEKVRFWAGQSAIQTEESMKNDELSNTLNVEDIEKIKKVVGFAVLTSSTIASEQPTITSIDISLTPSSTTVPSMADTLESYDSNHNLSPSPTTNLSSINDASPGIMTDPSVKGQFLEKESVPVSTSPSGTMIDEEVRVVGETDQSIMGTVPSEYEDVPNPAPAIDPATSSISTDTTFYPDNPSFEESEDIAPQQSADTVTLAMIANSLPMLTEGITVGTHVSEELPFRIDNDVRLTEHNDLTVSGSPVNLPDPVQSVPDTAPSEIADEVPGTRDQGAPVEHRGDEPGSTIPISEGIVSEIDVLSSPEHHVPIIGEQQDTSEPLGTAPGNSVLYENKEVQWDFHSNPPSGEQDFQSSLLPIVATTPTVIPVRRTDVVPYCNSMVGGVNFEPGESTIQELPAQYYRDDDAGDENTSIADASLSYQQTWVQKEATHEDPQKRALAAVLAGHLRDRPSLLVLANLARDPDSTVRERAGSVLVGIQDASLIATIAQSLSTVEMTTTTPSKQKELSPVSCQLVHLLHDTNVYIRRWAVWALGELREEGAINELVDIIHTTDGPLQQEAILALERMGAPAVRALVGELGHSSCSVQSMAASCLVRMGAPTSSHLVQVFKCDRDDAKVIASSLLAFGGMTSVHSLIDSLNTQDEQAEQWVISTLMNIGPMVIGPVLESAHHGNQRRREQVIRILKGIKDPQTLESLIDFMDTQDVLKRILIIEAIAAFNDPRVSPLLIKSLQDEDEEIRLTSVRALGKRREMPAIIPLIKRLRDRDERICQAAAQALGEIGETIQDNQ